MFDIFLGVLAALAVKELYFEVLSRVQVWRWKKKRHDAKTFQEYLEDFEADDED
jgi:hypothetical protein